MSRLALVPFLLFASVIHSMMMDNTKFIDGFSPVISTSSPHFALPSGRSTSSNIFSSKGVGVITTNTKVLHTFRPRSLSIMKSAKVLPIAYASGSAALLYRATQAVTKTDKAVLLATSAIALFNLGPTDNKYLSSAKKADVKHPPATSGAAKQRRQAAKTWRSTVRIKSVGQLLGLAWMIAAKSNNGQLRGGATVLAAQMGFFLTGGGGAVHDANGDHTPMPSGLNRSVLIIDSILTGSALLAASSPTGSGWRSVCAGIYVAGVSIGALEGLAALIKSTEK